MSLSFGVLYIVHFDNMHIPLGLGMLSPQLPLTFINRKHKDKRGLKVGILLFDVRGFFNNVNHGRMMAILENLVTHLS
jgi:hypothetical protein